MGIVVGAHPHEAILAKRGHWAAPMRLSTLKPRLPHVKGILTCLVYSQYFVSLGCTCLIRPSTGLNHVSAVLCFDLPNPQVSVYR